MRKENQVYLIPAYRKVNGVDTFCLVFSIYREVLLAWQNGIRIEPPNDVMLEHNLKTLTEYENLELLLKAFAIKPFCNVPLVLQPRNDKNAMLFPPIVYIRLGLFAPNIGAFITVGKGNNFKLGLLEVVKLTNTGSPINALQGVEIG